MDDISFIGDVSLRKNIEDSIEYMFALFKDTKNRKKISRLYLEETYRVIILYVVSVIEGILVHQYKKAGHHIPQIDYKYVTLLPEDFSHKEVV